MLIIDNISHRYAQTPVLHHVSFSVKHGTLTCLVGPSGCGKSTLLRIISGLETLQHGRVMINDMVLADGQTHTPPGKRNIGVMFQHPSLFPHLNVRSNVMFGLQHLSPQARLNRANEMLALVGMETRAESYPHHLSGGQHQRVALARALAPAPSIMLLDEPFANLDHALRRDIRDDVMHILRATDIPTIMVTHDPEEALMIADEMVLLRSDGTIHQTGSPDTIHNRPVDIIAARFFGYVNAMRGVVRNEHIESPLGKLSKEQFAGSYANDEPVIVATRPEGVRMAQPDEPGVSVQITNVAHTGAGWLITAQLPETANACATVRFHHIYGGRPIAGEKVRVTYEPPHIFIFPDDNAEAN